MNIHPHASNESQALLKGFTLKPLPPTVQICTSRDSAKGDGRNGAAVEKHNAEAALVAGRGFSCLAILCCGVTIVSALFGVVVYNTSLPSPVKLSASQVGATGNSLHSPQYIGSPSSPSSPPSPRPSPSSPPSPSPPPPPPLPSSPDYVQLAIAEMESQLSPFAEIESHLSPFVRSTDILRPYASFKVTSEPVAAYSLAAFAHPASIASENVLDEPVVVYSLDAFAHQAPVSALDTVLDGGDYSYPSGVFGRVRVCLYSSLGYVADAWGQPIGYAEDTFISQTRTTDRQYMTQYGKPCTSICADGVCTSTDDAVSFQSVVNADVKKGSEASSGTLTKSRFLKGQLLAADGSLVNNSAYDTWILKTYTTKTTISLFSPEYTEYTYECGHEGYEVVVFDAATNEVDPSRSYARGSVRTMRLLPSTLSLVKPALYTITDGIRDAIGLEMPSGKFNATKLGPNVFWNGLSSQIYQVLTSTGLFNATDIQHATTVAAALEIAEPQVVCKFKDWVDMGADAQSRFLEHFDRFVSTCT